MRITPDNCTLETFEKLIDRRAEDENLQYATGIEGNVTVYAADDVARIQEENRPTEDLLAEWASVLLTGPGVFVVRDAFPNPAVIDDATSVFNEMILEERQAGGGADHFAETGANDRVWNALEKLCLRAPDVFARYYANDILALAALSWLGPGYQFTSQINVVRPGGEAQVPHCDYHLGFQNDEALADYPAHVYRLSPMLTLQGAVAHCDMPPESGPTKILPYSHLFEPGYLASRREGFRACFEERCAQVPLAKGDAIFFNPALFHAAGGNRTKDVARMANLLQISSAFGRAMETVRRTEMCAALYPSVLAAVRRGGMSLDQARNTIAACAEGYPFPTDLDRNPPAGGLAPETQYQLMMNAVHEESPPAEFERRLRSHAGKSFN